MLYTMEVKPNINKGAFTIRGISKKITEDWLMLKNVVKLNAQASDVVNVSSFKKNKCNTSESEKVIGIARLKILIFESSFLKK